MDEAENNKQGASQKDAPKTLKVKHHRSPNFISDSATNVIVAGPSPDGFYHLIFFADVVAINHETAYLTGTSKNENITEAIYNTRLDKGDLETFREDKARISLPIKSLIELRDLLNRQLPIQTDKKTGTDEQS